VLAKTPPRIVDRESEIGTLVSSMLDSKKNLNYAVIGFRRIGKTTILKEVKRRLTEGKLIVVYLDFSLRRYDPIGFFKDVVNEATRAYHDLASPKHTVLDNVRAVVRRMAQLGRARIRTEITVDPVTGQPSIGVLPYLKEEEPDYSAVFRSTFDYVNQIADRSKTRAVIIIDEFQYMTEWKRYSGLEAVSEQLKSVIESRGDVSFIVSGSRSHFLKDFLSSGRSPLFGLFNIIEVSHLDEEASKELYVMNDSTAGEKDAEEAYRLVSGHPYYLVALAASRGAGEPIGETYQRILTSSTGPLNLYVKYVLAEDIGTFARGPIMSEILRALSQGPLTASGIAKASGVKLTSLPKFLRRLIDLDLVGKEGGKYQIIDRVIADYLKLNP